MIGKICPARETRGLSEAEYELESESYKRYVIHVFHNLY